MQYYLINKRDSNMINLVLMGPKWEVVVTLEDSVDLPVLTLMMILIHLNNLEISLKIPDLVLKVLDLMMMIGS